MSATIRGHVERIAPGGRGLIRDADGVVFARGGLPGEQVEVAVTRAQGGVRHGVVVRVLEASPDRVLPDCTFHGLEAGRCGGCDLLDLAPAAARRARERIVDDVLVRVGRLSPEVVARARRPLASPGGTDPPVDALRRRVRFVMVGGRPSFSSGESHARATVDRCPALHPVLDAALPLLARAGLRDGVAVRVACDDRGRRSAALEGGRPGDASRLVDAGVADGAIVLAPEGSTRAPRRGASRRRSRGAHGDGDEAGHGELGRAGDPILLGEVAPGHLCGDLPARSDASVFSQATRFGGRAILHAVLEAAAVERGTRVLELFAGSGHLTVPLLFAGAQVHAVEGAPRGVRFLEDNVSSFGPRCTTARAFIDEELAVPGPMDVLVADPPRTGIPGFAPLLSRIWPRRLVLVSCDPATGARDLAAAVAAGFTLEWLAPIDAFPRTSHVEWVASLQRNT